MSDEGLSARIVSVSRQFTTYEAAASFVKSKVRENRKAKIKTLFIVSVRVWLPTEEDRGFDGSASMIISRDQFLGLMESASKHLLKRGAKIRVEYHPPSLPGSSGYFTF